MTSLNQSFVMSASASDLQDWWGVAVQSGAANILKDGYNYKLSTYLYSDRDTLIENGLGGAYIQGTGNANRPAVGWSLYINGLRIAADTQAYALAGLPTSGSAALIPGKQFALPLKSGWNKIELLLYMPNRSDLVGTGAMAGLTIALLFRPNILSFNLTTRELWRYAPQVAEYPIWADGAPMQQVSEFVLKWATPPWARSRWAWRIEEASGTATHALLNYNPMPASGLTIDGTMRGSAPLFRLRYPYATAPTSTIYFKADLGMDDSAKTPPRIHSYQFMTSS